MDDPPAHHAVDRRDRPAFERGGQRRAEPVIEPRRLTRRLAVDQAIRALGVELDDPVPNDLPGHAADLGGLRARGAGIDRGQGEQPAGLAGVLRLARECPQLCGIEIRPERDRRGKPPALPRLADQNRCAHSRSPMDMMRQGCSTSLFQASQQWSRMLS